MGFLKQQMFLQLTYSTHMFLCSCLTDVGAYLCPDRTNQSLRPGDVHSDYGCRVHREGAE